MTILLLNGAQSFGHAGGKLNNTLHQIAFKQLVELGHQIQETHIETGDQEEQEVTKMLWADIVIYQMAGWWMSTPWKMKKYMDEVYTAGQGKLYQDDGRTRTAPSKQYGTGGLLQDHKYMLSVTWNAPQEAFEQFGNFFDGRGVDGVYFTFHKAQQFLGLTALPSFIANDVIKKPNIEATIAAYTNHLKQVIGKA